jgi:hypothetical protein
VIATKIELDPVVKALLRGAEKAVELLMDGTFTVVVEKLAEGYIKCMDLEMAKRWLREHSSVPHVNGSATKKLRGATKEYSKIFQKEEGELDE